MKRPLAHPTVEAVKAIHAEVLAAHGGSAGLRDEDLLESAVAAPQATMMGKPLLADPAVQIDFGDGPIAARATPLTDPQQVRDVLRSVRRKYLFAWLIQLLGRKAEPLAAEIVLEG